MQTTRNSFKLYLKIDEFKNIIKKTLIALNIFLFGLGSFLCFIIAERERERESKDRFLVSGIFLLLFAFVNNKLINLFVEKL